MPPRARGSAAGGSPGKGGVDVRVEGLANLLSDLTRLKPAVEQAWSRHSKSAAEKAATDARRRAPRLTGKLAQGIKVVNTPKGAELRSTAPHAGIHEFGGSHPVFGRDVQVFQPARPHVIPAVEAAGVSFDAAASKAVDDASREIGFK